MGNSYLWVLATLFFITFLFAISWLDSCNSVFLLIHYICLFLLQCKHQIAARLASSTGLCVDVKVSDEQLAVLLSNLWDQLCRNNVRKYFLSKSQLNWSVNFIFCILRLFERSNLWPKVLTKSKNYWFLIHKAIRD